MTKINPKLLSRIKSKLKVGNRRVYELIDEKMRETHLPRHLAAVALASTHGINISKFVTDDDLATIRTAIGSVPHPSDQTQRAKTRSDGEPKRPSQPHGVYKDPFVDDLLVAAASKNAELYPIVYVFENSVRRFVAMIMQEKFGPQWWEDKVDDKIKNTVQIRRVEESHYPWHSKRGADPIYYTDIDDLRKIISMNGQVFKKFCQIQRIQLWIEEIEKTRNTLAHNNPVAKKDRERLTVYARDWSDSAKSAFERIRRSS
jgi:hypothetical protein